MSRSVLAAVVSGAALLAACSSPRHDHGMMMGAGGGAMARATLAPTVGQTTKGTVMFHAGSDGVLVHARVEGLKPGQVHGFHVHEKGDCSAPDAMSAGGHFNPLGRPHGPQDNAHHAGDMPSLRANDQGVAVAHFGLAGLAIGGGATDIVGKAVVVHAMPDDYATQPTGNSGARIACGVIERG